MEITFDGEFSELPCSAHFYKNWKMPSLGALETRNVIPKFASNIPSQLHSCVLQLGSGTPFFEDGVEWNVDEIIRFLGSLENVAELEFELRKRTFSSSWG